MDRLLPAVALAGALAVILSALTRRAGSLRISRAAVVFSPAAAYGAGHFFVAGRTPFPPTDTTNWPPYFAIATAAVAVVAAVFPAFPIPSRAVRLAILGLLSAGAMRLLLAPKFRYAWSAEEGWFQVVGLSATILLATVGFLLTERRSPHPAEGPLLMVFLPAGTAVALMLSGSLLLGHFGFILSAAFVGSLLFFRRRPSCGTDAAAVFSLLHVSLLTCGYFFSDLPLSSAVLLALAPLLLSGCDGVFELFFKKPSFPQAASARRLLLAVALVAAALFIAFRSSPPWN